MERRKGMQEGTYADPGVRVHIRSGRHELVATSSSLTIDGREFALDAIDRVVYRAAAQSNRASYRISVAQGKEKADFLFDAYRRGDELKTKDHEWRRVVELLSRTAVHRISAEAMESISNGKTVTFGSYAGSKVDADALGLRRRMPFARKIPWAEITGSDFDRGVARVFTTDSRKQKPEIRIDMSGWNVVVLPVFVSSYINGS
ncbi:hypothetical protein [Streptacidiphilus sp. PAMC 29251]